MGIIKLIYPKNNDTDTRLGINIMQQVGGGGSARGQGGGGGGGG